ncbi:MAG: hypothetical protein R3C39_01205 [Dehalococcoidia bacterium]
MFLFAVSWSIALGAVALWAAARWLRRPTRPNARDASLAIVLAAVALVLTWWWLTR